MTSNINPLPLVDMSPMQFQEWLRLLTNEPLFADRNKLLGMLSDDADRETLAEGFREFFEAYSYELAFELDTQEVYILTVLEKSETFAHLKRRVAIVNAERKTSPIERTARRLGGIPNTPGPTIKVRTLGDGEFRMLIETLVNSELFAARERIVKLMKEPSSSAVHVQLQAAFYEFFVCHLELEQFLEDYEYDPDEGLEMRPEVAEELEHSITDYESGKVKGSSLAEVAKAFGVKRYMTPHPHKT